jgi:diguanylate cyclase (GGDEF)-like protein
MHLEAAQADAPEDTDRDFCCTMTSVVLRLVRSGGGEEAVTALLERAGTKHEASYLENVDNWISLDEACALLAAGVDETGNAMFARQVGEQMLRQHAGSPASTLLRSLGSPEAILKAIAQTAGKVTTVTEMEALEAGPGHAVVRAIAREGFTRHPLHCDWTTGLLAGTPILFGLPLARVEESECQARGGEQCLYTVSWDAELAAAAADPQQRVTALEAQMAAMSERLQSAYATASDLVSTEDLDTVLHRIVERAANAVRAPSHILAVHTAPGAELQVYSHGIDDRAAAALAHATLEHGAPANGSTLVVEVTSSRCHYGQLIAHYPGAIQFFPQEQEMLDLYAKHAAAVLDTATALQVSAQRHTQVSSLLSLAHAAAQAGTSEEVGQRLVAAVPDVVDCDRIAVWQWDESRRCISFLAGLGQTPEKEAMLRRLTISPDETPGLRRIIGEPRPQFVDSDSDDPFLSQLMAALDIAAMVVVPIIAHDVFLGLLLVIAEDRPQRLRLDHEMLDQLSGVAAIAAPAIQNGLLVDELRHKASHDGLTGLLNRVGFRQHIDSVLASVDARHGKVGLLFLDLDDFKQVNDVHGHHSGDEVLRLAAERLVAISRGADQVARLGGDEFAIILADVHRDDQVRAAEQRVRAAFVDPFVICDIPVSIGTSIGGVVWPEDGDTVNELVRRADAAMYRDKAEKHKRSIHALT